MRKSEPRPFSVEDKLQHLRSLSPHPSDHIRGKNDTNDRKSDLNNLLPQCQTLSSSPKTEQPHPQVETLDKSDIVPEHNGLWVYVLLVLAILVYNQTNPTFMGLVLLTVLLLVKMTPGKLRDIALASITLYMCYLPTTYVNLHPGLRQLYSCQTVLFTLKIWDYFNYSRNNNFSAKLALMHFSHLMVFLRPQKPATYSEIRRRFYAIPPILGWIVFGGILTHYKIHPVVTTLSEGFLFFRIVEFLNEGWAVYLMMISGWHVGAVFDQPYLSVSPREFWGKRWNLWVQDFQYKNIFAPLRKAGYHNLVGIIFVNLFACAFHEYMVYISHLSLNWTGYMTLFFTLNFAATMIEVYGTKAQIYQCIPEFFRNRIFRVFLTLTWIASTLPLFVRPFFGAWSTPDGIIEGFLEYGMSNVYIGSAITNRSVIQEFGVVTGCSTHARTFFHDIGSRILGFFGGEVPTYSELINRATKDATRSMMLTAQVGVFLYAVVYGTAVQLDGDPDKIEGDLKIESDLKNVVEEGDLKDKLKKEEN